MKKITILKAAVMCAVLTISIAISYAVVLPESTKKVVVKDNSGNILFSSSVKNVSQIQVKDTYGYSDIPDEFWDYAEPDAMVFTINGVSFAMQTINTDTSKEYSLKGGSQTLFPASERTKKLSDYKLGVTEVTQALWDAVEWNQVKTYSKVEGIMASWPVSNVSESKVRYFISYLNTFFKDQIGDYQFCLPTEHEWEYAAYGGVRSLGYTYSGSNTLNNVAWNTANSAYQYSSYNRHPVGQLRPNELVLYDMSGNVSEMIDGDYFMSDTGRKDTDCRTIRGGSYIEGGNSTSMSYFENKGRTYYSTIYSEQEAKRGFRLCLRKKQ